MAENVNSITCYLYRNFAEPNRVFKDNYISNANATEFGINSGLQISGTFKENIDFTNPSITIEYNGDFIFNYIRIAFPSGSKYYFINKITCVRYNIYVIDCTVDVLMTYKTLIYNRGMGFVERNEFVYNDFIPDNNRVLQLGQDVQDTSINNNVLDSTNFGVWLLSGIALNSLPRSK